MGLLRRMGREPAGHSPRDLPTVETIRLPEPRRDRSPILSRRRLSFSLVLASAAALPILAGFSPRATSAVGADDPSAAKPPVAQKPNVLAAIRAEEPDLALQRDLASYVATLGGTYGVAAYDFTTGRTVRINDDRLFPSASLYKLIVLHQVHDEVARGRLRLDDLVPITRSNLQSDESSDLKLGDRPTVAEAVHLMITISSNTAAHALLERLGRDEFNRTAAKLGLADTWMPVGNAGAQLTGWRRYMASTSPRDMLKFFQLLATRQLVDPRASDAMLAVLFDQRVNDRIPAGLPSSAWAAHKTGELNGVRNDAGFVLTGDRAYAVVVLSQNADEDEATAAIAEIARRVHARYGAEDD